MSEIIKCPNCGQKNRIKENDKYKAKCAKCWTSLADKEQNKSTQTKQENKSTTIPIESSNVSYFFQEPWFIIMIVIIGFVIFINLDSSSSSNKNITKTVKNDYPIIAMPYSGKVESFTYNEKVAPLTIQTSAGANYLVKLVDYYSKSEVMTIFVNGGDTTKVKVPLGVYEIKYASGTKWYGYQHLFGDETSYSKAENSFSFKNTGYQITGYTITLYRVSNGNLRTSHINKSEF